MSKLNRITTRLERVVPMKAQAFLDERADNRPISAKYARQLAEAIKSGEFEINGETLKFDDNDRMIDGQHRCLACVLAGVPFETFITRGLNSSTFDTIDTGNKRTVAHVFAKHGEANYSILAGAVAWLWRYTEGHLATSQWASPRHPEAIALLESHPGIRDSLHWGRHLRGLAPSSLMVFLHYIFACKDKEAANWFFDHLNSGEELTKSGTKTSAILILRKRLIDDRTSKAKLPSREIAKLTIKAWNAYRAKRVIKYLRHRAVGSAKETFPEIHG